MVINISIQCFTYILSVLTKVVNYHISCYYKSELFKNDKAILTNFLSFFLRFVPLSPRFPIIPPAEP